MAALALALLAGTAPAVAGPPLPRLGAAPNFALTTQQNARIWLAHLRGRVVVLTFGCTGCDPCPGLLGALRDTAAGLGPAAGRRVFFAWISVDPAHDTPAVLRGFAHEHGLDPAAWVLFTGSPAEIDVVTGRYGVAVHRDGRVEAECLAVLIDGAGVIRGRYGPANLARLRPDLQALLAG